MNFSRALFVVGFVVWVPRATAVYAPIPEVEQGKALTLYLEGGAYYDTNIFGGADNELASAVYQLTPTVAFNMSASDQTFLSARYRLSLDHYDRRPGDKTLDSHVISGRLAHTFSPIFEAELNETYQITKNPESLLPGLSTILATDQSYTLNQIDGRLAANITRRTGVTLKLRTAHFAYDNANLANELDRAEYIVGVAVTHAVAPDVQAVAEYRHQSIRYAFLSEQKDKESDFALTGADYVLTQRAALSGRLGVEYRRRKGAEDEAVPYAEIAGKLDYAKGSYVSGGYGFSVEEVSNLDRYTDIDVHKFFVNVQHVLTPKMVASVSLNWAPSKLNSRPGVGPREDPNETNTKLGLALIYRINDRLSVSATFDHDRVDSDDNGRDLERRRAGATARWVF